MRKGQRQVRLCLCGCGQQTQEAIGTDGRFRGYRRYINGHGREAVRERQAVRTRALLASLRSKRTLPVGARRIHNEHGNAYWQIKVAEPSVWMYEHRYIVSQQLGRRLERSEHVHHINGDGLDNSPENLVLMSHSAHASLTHKGLGPSRTWRGGPHHCPICKVLH